MNVLSSAVHLLFPDRCPGCGAFGTLLCEHCRGRLPAATGPGRCPHCCGRWAEPINCPRCFTWDAVDRTIVACEMEGVARRLVHGLKYRGVLAFAGVMADLIGAVDPGWAPALAFAVPLHLSRERRRGFNQAAVLVSRLGWERSGGSLVRLRGTASQVGRREQERRRNVAGAFRYDGPPLGGREVAVVDDVITTGATITECARVLREHGAGRVVAAAFARAHYEPGSRQAIYD